MTESATDPADTAKNVKHEIDRVWRRYQRDRGNLKLRNTLVEHFLYLPRTLAGKFAAKMPLEFDDVFSSACEGLMEAVEKFDPDCGSQFSTFAQWRIRGAMLDHLRKTDFVPRLERQRQRDYQNTVALLTRRLNRRPTTQEIEDELPADPLVGAIPGMLSLEDKIRLDRGGDGKEPTLADSLPARRGTLSGDDFSFLAAYLSEEERTAVYLYFFKEVTMHTIGLLLGYSESRISQMVSRSLKRLAALEREEFLRKAKR